MYSLSENASPRQTACVRRHDRGSDLVAGALATLLPPVIGRAFTRP